MKTKLIALSFFSAALATSTIASAQMQGAGSNPHTPSPYSADSQDIGANLIGGLYGVIKARLTELKIRYKANGEYDVIMYTLDKSAKDATSKSNIKKAVNTM